MEKEYFRGSKIIALLVACSVMWTMFVDTSSAEESMMNMSIDILCQDDNYALGTVGDIEYVGSDEIWLVYENANETILLQTNDQLSETKRMISVANPFARDLSEMCLNRVENEIMVGFRDDQTINGYVYIFEEESTPKKVIELPINVGIQEMIPTEKGIVCFGFFYLQKDDKETTHLYLCEVTNSGQISEINTNISNDTSIDRSRLPSSLCCCSAERYYIQANMGNGDNHQITKTLYCFDKTGTELWVNELPSDWMINDIVASDKEVYLLGSIDEFDDYDSVLRPKAFVACYSDDGSLLWQYRDANHEMFRWSACDDRGVSLIAKERMNICITRIGVDGCVLQRGICLFDSGYGVLEYELKEDNGLFIGLRSSSENEKKTVFLSEK